MTAAVGDLPDLNSGAGLYQCGDCKRSYTRLDHLSRHVRSHTQEKPYTCQVCNKSFSRVDLLKRHAEGHKPDSAKRQKRQTSPSSTRRVAEACEACVKVHLRCEHNKPCSRCRKKQIVCKAPARDNNGDSQSHNSTMSMGPFPLDIETNEQTTQMAFRGGLQHSMSGSMSGSEPPMAMPNYDQNHSGLQSYPNGAMNSMNGMPGGLNGGLNLDTTFDSEVWALPDFLRNMMPPIPTLDQHSNFLNAPNGQQPPNSGTWTPRGFLDFGLDFNLDMDDTDFNYLDNYNSNAPFDLSTPVLSSSAIATDLPDDTDLSQHGVALRSEAFRKSIWRFKPKREDHSAAEQVNLILPAVEDEANSPESRVALDRRTTPERLQAASRDQILVLILKTCKPNNVARTVAAFPSLELLDRLLQYYLTSPFVEIRKWLHVPSFFPIAQNHEGLLTVLIAAGAILAPDNSLRKLGFAFHEAARQCVTGNFEEDNSTVRNLQSLQAFMLLLETGLWSGNSRRMEIAESFVQPLTTMLRRGGKFRHFSYLASPPLAEDHGEVLESKWRAWIEQESFSRLVFHLYQHDAQTSMALLTSPIISFAELLLPLPDIPALWEAPNPEAWKNIWLNRANVPTRRPTLLDCMNDVTHLSLPSQFIDIEQSNMACLYANWALVWEYRQLSSAMKAQSGHTLLLQSRHQELLQTLEYLRLSCDGIPHQTSGLLTVVFEIILMHLHISMEDMQLFAGLEGQHESQRVYPSLREWANTPSARQAIWHAGQVIRAAREAPNNAVRNFYAIAVYHASLAFWTYGLITGVERRALIGDKDRSSPTVWLDATESMASQRFTGLQRGSPAIQSFESNSSSPIPVYIDEPGAVMSVIIDVLRNNHDVMNGPRPPLVENLIQLMGGLRAAATVPKQNNFEDTFR